jgi:hypothetical protein
VEANPELLQPLTIITSAATFAGLLTSLAKFGFPALPSYAVMLISLVSGILGAFLVAVANGDVLTSQMIAQCIIAGVAAAATAAGIDRASRSADVRREAARLGAFVDDE